VKLTAVALIKCQIEDEAELAHGSPGDGDPREPDEEIDYHSGQEEESTGYLPRKITAKTPSISAAAMRTASRPIRKTTIVVWVARRRSSHRYYVLLNFSFRHKKKKKRK
jgi:hypothetical protein